MNGPAEGDLLVIGWGGTYGSITTAVQRAQRKGLQVAQAHLRYLNPMPRNTGEVLKRYKKVLVPELNGGQLRMLLRATYLVDAVGLNKVQGRPFLVSEIEAKIEELTRLNSPASRGCVKLPRLTIRDASRSRGAARTARLADVNIERSIMSTATTLPDPDRRRTWPATRKCAGAPAAATIRSWPR